MYKKHNLLLLITFTIALIGNSQTVRSVTNIETSTSTEQAILIGNTSIEQSLFWRKRYSNEGKEKDSYVFHSIYLKDSAIGFKYFGYEINLLHETFENSRTLNKFRHWNTIRIGTALSVEHIFWNDYYPKELIYEYFNANIYVKYYHIPTATRGDRTTKNRIGSWGFVLDLDYNGRVYGDLHAKLLPYVRTILRYKKTKHNTKYYSLLFEFELNEHGYDKHGVEASKELYNGFSFFIGPEYNSFGLFTLNFGIKMDYRNH